MKIKKNKALLIIDMQHDFITGSLAVNGAEGIIPLINKKIKDFDLIIFTRDFHPANHKSFASNNEGKKDFDQIILDNGINQTLWPDHCIQGTKESEIHPDILGNPELKNKDFYIFKKGMNPEWDSHSGFYDNGGKSTGLTEFLRDRNIEETHIVGLATEFCVLLTALDSVKDGFETIVYKDCIKHINDPELSIETMKSNKIKII